MPSCPSVNLVLVSTFSHPSPYILSRTWRGEEAEGEGCPQVVLHVLDWVGLLRGHCSCHRPLTVFILCLFVAGAYADLCTAAAVMKAHTTVLLLGKKIEYTYFASPDFVNARRTVTVWIFVTTLAAASLVVLAGGLQTLAPPTCLHS